MEQIIKNIETAYNNTTDANTKAELKAVLDSWNLSQNLLSNIVLDTATKTITMDGAVTTLTNQEFKTMQLLAENDRPMKRDEILENAWDFSFVGARTVDVHIRKLRIKLGNDLIVTRKGVGYSVEERITIK
jgi:two-component system, OmpR family, alkaline phosphatase synthesis response regulator PhoP